MTIANITWLTDDLATGGDFSQLPYKAAEQLHDLLTMDVGTVIDCRAEMHDYRTWKHHDEVEYHWLPTDDAYGWTIPAEHFDRAVYIARQARDDGRKVFAHCHMGVNRGPSTAMAILLDRGYSAAEAFDLIRDKRPIARVDYAEDAIRAHYERLGWSKSHVTRKVNEFTKHAGEVWTPEARAMINHTIRQHHQNDANERAGY